jgi:hypothetical protein
VLAGQRALRWGHVLQVLDQVRQVLLAIEKLESMGHER